MFAADTIPHAWHHHSPYPPRLARLRALDQDAAQRSSRHHTSCYTEPSNSTSASTLHPARARHEPKKNISRERMKSELLALRVQASCLETELAYLQQLAQERDAASHGVLDTSELVHNHSDPPMSAASGWKFVAERQRARRLRAEMQNQRLRSFVEAQRDEWASLETLFGDKSRALLSKIANVQGVRVDTSAQQRQDRFLDRDR